jgi:hypothetical protein
MNNNGTGSEESSKRQRYAPSATVFSGSNHIATLFLFSRSPPTCPHPPFSHTQPPLLCGIRFVRARDKKNTSHQADEGKWEPSQPVPVRGKGANPGIVASFPVFSEDCVEKGMVRRAESKKK